MSAEWLWLELLASRTPGDVKQADVWRIFCLLKKVSFSTFCWFILRTLTVFGQVFQTLLFIYLFISQMLELELLEV